MNYKTPGVYLEEISLFPPSVATLATAIPAFVGYTEKTKDAEEEKLINQPKRVTSLLEYKALFGGSYNSEKYKITLKDIDSLEIEKIEPQNGSGKNRDYYLYDSIRHYFDNGGGPCYVVSVGNYSDEIILGDEAGKTGLLSGLKSLRQEEEPTLLLIPDSVLLANFTNTGTIHKEIAKQCADLQDRFGILDIYKRGLPKNNLAFKLIDKFRNEIGTENLKYVAAYYPWLYSTYKKEVHFTQLEIVDKNDDELDITIIGDDKGLIQNLQAKISAEETAFSQLDSDDPLTRDNCTLVTKWFYELVDNINSGKTNGNNVKEKLGKLVHFVNRFALGLKSLDDEVGNSAELNSLKSVLDIIKADTSVRKRIKQIIEFEKYDGVKDLLGEKYATDYSDLDGSTWIDKENSEDIQPSASTGFTGNNTEIGRAAANSDVLFETFSILSDAYMRIIENAIFKTNQAESKLFQEHSFYKKVYERISKEMSLLPPSGAVAGIYAAVDRERGVWKAPANVSINGIMGLAVKLNDRDQEDLNIHSTGKSINAIRQFTGRGALLWGARTLDGNSNEWRYINVRRFFIMVEEATKKASAQFVFESNDANTWVKVRAMLENFLMQQWRAGALAGAKPEQAYYVSVGLGKTMTAQDVLEGRMIVEIGMAVVRPAEFIILRFSHKMQES